MDTVQDTPSVIQGDVVFDGRVILYVVKGIYLLPPKRHVCDY
jgi:hypothetical protein